MRITYVNYAISICARLSLTAYLLCIMQIKLCISFELSSSALASQPRPRPRLRLPLRLWVSEHGHHVVVPSVQIAAGCSTRPAWLASHALSLAVVVLLNAEWDAQKDKQRQAECGQESEQERGRDGDGRPSPKWAELIFWVSFSVSNCFYLKCALPNAYIAQQYLSPVNLKYVRFMQR